MNILFIEWKSFGNEDIKDAFRTLHHDVFCFCFDGQGELHHDDRIEQSIQMECENRKIDFVFSFNYYPIIARACHEINIPYLSWIYDNPYVLIYSHTVIYPTNHIFVFDKSQYLEFHNNNINTVHYMPLAANTRRLDIMLQDTDRIGQFQISMWNNKAPIAFVGSMYTESHQFYERLVDISERTRGYLEGIMEAQKHVYGYNFIQDMLTEEIMNDMSHNLPMKPDSEGAETRDYLFAEYVINRKLTAIERKEYLLAISEYFKSKYEQVIDLYTPDKLFSMQHIINHGKVDYYDVAPYVYNQAKINLNITLRSIHTGIPLRAFDVMGAGGFLLTNYQEDFCDCYLQGEDYVSFDSKEDMLEKIEYYLEHEHERSEIALNGRIKTKKYHTYESRIEQMLKYINV